MKTKDYFLLAKRSLKERKKATAATISGLAVGFIILIPILILLLGLNVNINKQLNAAPYLLYGETSMTDYHEHTTDFYNVKTNNYNVSGSKNLPYFINDDNIDNLIVFERHVLPNVYGASYALTYRIDENAFNPLSVKKGVGSSFYSIIDIEKSKAFFPRGLTDNYNGGIFVKGCDSGFSATGKGEVVIAEKLLTLNGLTANDVYQKNITLAVKDSINLSPTEKTEVCGYICSNYKIVGVIRNEVSELYCFNNSYNMYSYMYSDLFFSSASVYSDGQGVLKPVQKADSNGNKYLVYDNLKDKDVLNQTYMMLGWFRDSQIAINGNNETTIFSTCLFFESLSYSLLHKSVIGMENRINAVFNSESSIISLSPAFTKYEQVYREVNAASVILGVVGLIVAICAVINLYSSIKHSISQRKIYLTFLRAIGAKDSVIPRLYFTEATVIISRAALFIGTIGLVISIILKLSIDKVLSLSGVSYSLGIPWAVVIVCVVSMILLLYMIGLCLAYFCAFRLSKRPIVSVLKDY